MPEGCNRGCCSQGHLVGVKISMNGGTVFVNPSIGANFSGGAGSGGAVQLLLM